MSADTSAQATRPAVDPGTRRIALGLLFAAYMLSITDRMILSVLFEPIKAEFSLSDTQLGLLGGLTFALFYATLGIPIAKYADRNDRRRLIAACLILFSAMTALSGMATVFLMLVLFRIFVGVGEAGVNPASHSIIADYYPRNERSLAMSTLAVGGNFGMIFGFLIGGFVSEAYGWRAAMFVVGVPGVLLGISMLYFLKEPQRGGAETHVEAQPTSQISMLQAVKVMFATPVLRQVLAATTVSGMVTYSVTQWLPAYFGRVHELPQGQVGIVMAVLFGGVAGIGTLTGGRLTDVLSRRRIDLGPKMIALTQLVSVPLMVVGYLSTSMVLTICLLAAPIFILTFYVGPGHALIQSYAPVQMRAMGSALKMFSINLIGLGLGPLIVGIISDILEPAYGPRGLAIALAIVSVLSVWSATHFWLAGRAMLALEEEDAGKPLQNP